jgi:1,4-alpha-glucan branching enzyme
MTPGEYICKQNRLSITSGMPEFSSWGFNGYAEPWLDASNDWMYPHVMQALERMVELAERFPNDSGLKERALNQAAREILLVQASDWPRMLYKQEHTEYARNQVEMALRNFTTIYESLGSNYISTEWLTSVERRHNFFPNINYRVFRRKQ